MLSKKERRILDCLVTNNVSECATMLKMEKGAVYAALYRLRKKRVATRKFLNKLLGYENKSPRLKRFLMPTDRNKK